MCTERRRNLTPRKTIAYYYSTVTVQYFNFTTKIKIIMSYIFYTMIMKRIIAETADKTSVIRIYL